MTEDELKRINKFIRITDKIRNSNFLKTTKFLNFKMNIEINKPARFEADGFNEDLLKSALMDFRKIYMKKEDTNFFKMYNLLYANTNDVDLKKNLEKCRENFSVLVCRSPATKCEINSAEASGNAPHSCS